MTKKRLTQAEVEAVVAGNPYAELTGSVPVPEGIVDGKIDTPSMEELSKLPPLKRVELSESLSSLSNDFAFFNYTMLFSKGGMDFDPFKEYQMWKGRQDVINYAIFNRPLFDGFDFSDRSGGHDKMLAFVNMEDWAVIERALVKFTILNRKTNSLFLCEMSKVKIPDPKQPNLTIEPYVWKMYGSNVSWGYAGFPVPKIVKKPADPEAKRLMKAVNNEPI